jgi:hypothetical protein
MHNVKAEDVGPYVMWSHYTASKIEHLCSHFLINHSSINDMQVFFCLLVVNLVGVDLSWNFVIWK